MTSEAWARLVLGRAGPALPRGRDGLLCVADVRVRDPEPWLAALRAVLDVGPAAAGRTDLTLLVVEARRGEELARLRPGGHGLVVGKADAVLGLGRRSRAELGAWRLAYPAHAALVGEGGRVALWSTRGLRPAGSPEPRLVALRERSRSGRRSDTIDASGGSPDPEGS